VGTGPIPSGGVVAEAVVVVVDAVRLASATRLARVGPQVRGQVRVRARDAAVDHGDSHGWVPAGQIPGLRGVDVGVRRAGRTGHGLTRVVQAPELTEVGVARDAERAAVAVRLRVEDAGLLLEPLGGLGRGGAWLR